MKFLIHRASLLYEYRSERMERPCDAAYSEKFMNEKGEKEVWWYIDINTLEELLALSKAVGESLIINEAQQSILIYDEEIE